MADGTEIPKAVRNAYARDLVRIGGLSVPDALAVVEAAWAVNIKTQQLICDADKNLPPRLSHFVTAMCTVFIGKAMEQAKELQLGQAIGIIIARMADDTPVAPNKEGQFK